MTEGGISKTNWQTDQECELVANQIHPHLPSVHVAEDVHLDWKPAQTSVSLSLTSHKSSLPAPPASPHRIKSHIMEPVIIRLFLRDNFHATTYYICRPSSTHGQNYSQLRAVNLGDTAGWTSGDRERFGTKSRYLTTLPGF